MDAGRDRTDSTLKAHQPPGPPCGNFLATTVAAFVRLSPQTICAWLHSSIYPGTKGLGAPFVGVMPETQQCMYRAGSFVAFVRVKLGIGIPAAADDSEKAFVCVMDTPAGGGAGRGSGRACGTHDPDPCARRVGARHSHRLLHGTPSVDTCAAGPAAMHVQCAGALRSRVPLRNMASSGSC